MAWQEFKLFYIQNAGRSRKIEFTNIKEVHAIGGGVAVIVKVEVNVFEQINATSILCRKRVN